MRDKPLWAVNRAEWDALPLTTRLDQVRRHFNTGYDLTPGSPRVVLTETIDEAISVLDLAILDAIKNEHGCGTAPCGVCAKTHAQYIADRVDYRRGSSRGGLLQEALVEIGDKLNDADPRNYSGNPDGNPDFGDREPVDPVGDCEPIPGLGPDET